MCVYRHGTRTEDLRSGIDCAASVIVVASDSYVQHPKTQTELATIADICSDDDACGKRSSKPLLVIAMDAVTAKTVRRLLPNVKSSCVLVWGTSDFWQKLMYKLPDPCPVENVDISDASNVVKKYDDEMWTYLKGVKVESSLAEASKENFSLLQNSFSGPSGDSSLSTHSTDNSGGSLTHNSKRRSATLNHMRTSPRGGKTEFQNSELPNTAVTAATMMGRRSRDPTSGNRRHTASRRSDSARVFENPLDKFESGQNQMLGSDSDYMSVNDSLLRQDNRRVPGNNNEPIYHTLEDDDDGEQVGRNFLNFLTFCFV